MKNDATLSVGPRYVFFNTLYLENQRIYQRALQTGKQLVNAAASQLTPEVADGEGLERIHKYIESIGKIAQKEREIEFDFIKKCKDLIKDKNNNLLIKNLDDFINETDIKNGIFNYEKLINLINRVLEKDNELGEVWGNSVNNLRVVSENFEKLNEDVQQEYREAFETNYRAFTSKAKKTLLEPLENGLKYNTSITSLYSTKINSALRYLSQSKTLENKVKEAWTDNWSSEYIAKELLAIVVKYVTNIPFNTLKKEEGKEIAEQIEDQLLTLKEKITPQEIENIVNLVQERTRRSIEEVALTSRRGIADMFLALTQEEKEKMQEVYGFKADLEKIRKKIEDKEIFSSKEKEKITKAITASIRKKAKEDFGDIIDRKIDEDYKTFKKRITSEISKRNSDFFKKRNLEKNLQNCIKVKITGPSAAEYYASDKFLDQLNAALTIPGKQILLKTDASATIFLDENIEFELPENKETVISIINNFSKNFLETYNENSQGKIDVSKAEETYKNTMKNLIKQVDDYAKEHKLTIEEHQKMLEALKNFLTTNISVKDYTYGSNQLGFHGGSLGFNGEKVIENIEKMYNLGGITNIDKNLLYFALINCSEAALGADLKDDLATFLLGGAALMLFDDGFTATENFLSSMISEFGFAPKAMHVFALQTGFVPASYVYTQIYSNLIAAYGDISSEYYTLGNGESVNNNRVVITNNISPKDIPTNYHRHDDEGNDQTSYAQPQARWDYISNLVNSSVNVEIIFMAGILDLFEKIPKAFDV